VSLLKQHKATKIIETRNRIESNAASLISQLNVALNEAIKYAILLEENPDDMFSEEDKAEIREDFSATFGALMEVIGKASLLNSMKEESIDLDSFKASSNNSNMDVLQYLNEISR